MPYSFVLLSRFCHKAFAQVCVTICLILCDSLTLLLVQPHTCTCVYTPAKFSAVVVFKGASEASVPAASSVWWV